MPSLPPPDDVRTPLRDNCPECGILTRPWLTRYYDLGVEYDSYSCGCGHRWATEWRTA